MDPANASDRRGGDERGRRGRRVVGAVGLAGLLVGTWDALLVARSQRRAARLVGLARDHDAVVAPAGAPGPAGLVGEGLGEPLRLVVLGDSAADGFGLADPADAFPRQLAVRLSLRTGRRVQVRSWAVNGARTADLVANQVPVLPAARPDVVVASCGVNDVVHRTPLDRLEADTAALLVALQRAVPAAEVVLVGCPDLSRAPGIAWPLSVVVRRRCRGVARLQGEVAARQGVAFAPLEPTPGPELFGEDGFHPGREAQAMMAEAAMTALRRRPGPPGATPPRSGA